MSPEDTVNDAARSANIRDVFARPVDVLNKTRQLDLTCILDAKSVLPASTTLRVRIEEEGRTIATTTKNIKIENQPKRSVSP